MTSTAIAVRPKDLEAGQLVAITWVDGGTVDVRVEKNTPKSGRVRVREDGADEAQTVQYRDIADISLDREVTDEEEQAERREDALLDRAIGELGLDVDPSNYDEQGLAEAVGFVDQNRATFERAGIPFAEVGEMTSDVLQRLRAATDGKKDGLVGKALAEWIRTGDSGATKAKADRVAKRATREPRGLREGSTMWAVLEVLRKARKPLTAAEVAEKIISGKMAPGLKGKTPEATIAAAMNVAVKRGQHGIVRPTPGHFELDRSK